MAKVSHCDGCKKALRTALAEFKAGGELRPCCLAAMRPRLKLTPLVSSAVAHSKTIENQVSRYLFGSDRDWKEQHDISGGGWIGEVKDYSYTLIASSGGPVAVLEAALAQCQEAHPEGKHFSVLHIKGGKNFEASLVMLDDCTMCRLDHMKGMIDSTGH